MKSIADRAEIVRALTAIVPAGQVTELRALDTTLNGGKWPGVISGYFSDPEALATAACSITHAKGIYIVANPVKPDLLARAENRIRPAGKNPTTSDTDIERRQWLLIDADAIRPAGISASNVEHETAIAKTRAIYVYLKALGWPDPIAADSGNGAHLMYRIDLPVADDGLVERCLKALAQRFNDGAVLVDTTNFNPARIWKLYGTPACKGDNTVARPHRLAKLLSVPAELKAVPSELLEALAGPKPQPETQNTPRFTGKTFDLDAWIRDYNLDVRGPETWKDGRRWIFRVCPWNSAHTNESAFILQMSNGAIAAGCQHNGCAGNDWHSLRDKVEPGWRDHRSDGAGQPTCNTRNKIEPASEKPAEAWPDPLSLPAGLPPVMPFDFNLLPVALHRWIQDISERMQCPPDYCAATAMIVAGALIGRKVAIRPKRHDDWQVVANLYGVNIGRPSLMKTPAMKEMLKFLARLEVEAKQEYAKALAEHEAAALIADATKKVRKEKLKKAVKDGGDAQAIAEGMASDIAAPPTRRRYLVNDTTVEKLGMTLAENPNGVLLFADELVSLLRTMEREGHEGDRGFYLTAWAGDSRYTYDRVGRGTLDIEAAIVSIAGSIQPGVLADYLRGAVRGGNDDDGLIQRFQMTVWPDAPTTWQNVDHYPDADAKATAHAALQRLADLTPDVVDAERDNYDRDALPFLHFDPTAQDIFDRWRADLETRLRSGVEHPAVESHLAKYRSLISSLALILHLLDGGVGPVNAIALEKAIGWGQYLESHARRLYAGVTEASAVAARALAARIQTGEVPNPFAARDVYRMGWTGLDREQTEAAIDVLLSMHWLDERIETTPGRTRTRYVVNPKIEISQEHEPTLLTKAPSVSNVSTVPKENPVFDDAIGGEDFGARCSNFPKLVGRHDPQPTPWLTGKPSVTNI